MDAKQHLYYSIGLMAYAVAKADGKIQDEEKKKLQEIVERELEHSIDFDYANIIFQILDHDKQPLYGVFDWAVDALKTGKHYLTPEFKQKIKDVLNAVADAFPPTTKEEQEIKDKFITIVDQIGNINLPLK